MRRRTSRWMLLVVLALLAVLVVWVGLRWGRSTAHAAAMRRYGNTAAYAYGLTSFWG